jgi:hypothetical protein
MQLTELVPPVEQIAFGAVWPYVGPVDVPLEQLFGYLKCGALSALTAEYPSSSVEAARLPS